MHGPINIKNSTSHKLCYVKAKIYLQTTNISECSDSKTSITEIPKGKTSWSTEQFQPATFKHNSRTPGCEKLS